MATIERRTSHGQNVYYVKVRRKGYPPQSATFHKLSDAKRWVQMTEGAIVEGRYFPQIDAKRHTISDLLSRYRQDVFPQKRSSTVYNQVYHLQWWEAQLGHYRSPRLHLPLGVAVPGQTRPNTEELNGTSLSRLCSRMPSLLLLNGNGSMRTQ